MRKVLSSWARISSFPGKMKTTGLCSREMDHTFEISLNISEDDVPQFDSGHLQLTDITERSSSFTTELL